MYEKLPSFIETYNSIKADVTKGERNFNVECTMLPEGMQTEMKMDQKPFIIKCDAPQGLDGTNEAPSPLLVILASIGACIISVTKFWSKIDNIAIDEMKVFSRGHINLAGILGIDEKILPGYDTLEPIIRIKSSAPKEKVEELMAKVMSHCPIITNMKGVTPIKPKLEIK